MSESKYVVSYYISDPKIIYNYVIEANNAATAIAMFNEIPTHRKSKITKVELEQMKEKLRLPLFKFPPQSLELWNIIRKYHKNPDAPVEKVTVYLRVGVGSGIFCEYAEGYDLSSGNTSLEDNQRDELFKELKEKKFLPDIKYVQEVTIGITGYEMPKIGVLYIPVKSL